MVRAGRDGDPAGSIGASLAEATLRWLRRQAVVWGCCEGGACWGMGQSDVMVQGGRNFFPLASDVKAYAGLSQRATLVACYGMAGGTLAHVVEFPCC
jgi:hypothetical protein